MTTLGPSKRLKAVIVILFLFLLPLTHVALAKGGRGKSSSKRGSDSKNQQVKRTSKTTSTKPSVAAAGKKPTRVVSKPSKPAVRRRIQQKPQVLQRITTSPRKNRPVITRPQVQIHRTANSSRLNTTGSRIRVTKPSSGTSQNRRITTITRAPRTVEVRRPGNANTSSQQRAVKPNVQVNTKPKPDIATRINAPARQRPAIKIERKPVKHEKLELSRSDQIVTRIETPPIISKPTAEQEHNNGRADNVRRTAPLLQLRDKPKPPSKPEVRVINKPQRTDNQPRRSGGPVKINRDNRTDSAQRNDHREIQHQGNNTSGKPRQFNRNRSDNNSRGRRDGQDQRTDFVRSNRRTTPIGSGDHDFRRFRPARTTRVSFEDRVRTFGHIRHNNFAFRDQHHRLINRIIWPRYHYPVYYRWGGHYSFHYVYPFYQRRYVFVSLGGFWPSYTYVRYYWYPVHSFLWYGYAPLAYEVPGDTYNYYTYNYYTTQPASTTVYSTEPTGLTPVDADTFADVREKLNQEQQGPDAQTVADTLFDEGVKEFGQGGYAKAADKFAAAMALAPDDEILPFAYAQALFADGRYSQAADVLRKALQKVTPEKEGVYYPRGLYLDENTLDEQIDGLAEKTGSSPDDSDLQLLLGYNLLGVGETEQSIEPLTRAKEDYKNFDAATVLLDLAEKIKAGETQ